jgi:hypothetical protein
MSQHRNSIEAARKAISNAEKDRADADIALTAARDQLDQALAARGWNRFYGAYDARLYTHLTNPHNPVPLDDVLRMFELEAAL